MDDVNVTVRVTEKDGILLSIGGVTFNPSYEQAVDLAKAMNEDPAKYGLGDLPDAAKKLVEALRTGAEIWRAASLGGFKTKGTAS